MFHRYSTRSAVFGFAFAAVAASFAGPAFATSAPSAPGATVVPAVTLPATPGQVEGPYFLNNSPVRNNLVPAGVTGQVIKISGTVRDTHGNVIPNATIHVWLADPRGKYDNQDANGDPEVIPPAQQHLRGRVVADAQGNYSFECLRPGNYEVAPNRMRPAHIHIRIEAAGHNTVVTQLYFPDDQWNTHDLPGPGFFKPELLVPLQPATAVAGKPQTGTFNFVIK